MSQIISVTEDDITQGRPCSLRKCPIARALRRAMENPSPKEVDIRVGINGEAHISVFPGGVGQEKHTCLALPRNAQKFITRFDQELDVEPIDIEIEFEDIDY